MTLGVYGLHTRPRARRNGRYSSFCARPVTGTGRAARMAVSAAVSGRPSRVTARFIEALEGKWHNF